MIESQIITALFHFVGRWTQKSRFVKNEPYVARFSDGLNKSQHLETAPRGRNWNAVKMRFIRLTWIW